jgi:hypothetical protein
MPAHALFERFNVRSGAARAFGAASGRSVAPEEPDTARLGKLLEPRADVLQQAMLPALVRQALELLVYRTQIAHEAVELCSSFGVLREQRLGVLGRCGFGFHEIFLAWSDWNVHGDP